MEMTVAALEKLKHSPKHLEDSIQRAIVKFARMQYPKVMTFAIPNGGKRSKAEAGIMKSTGTLPGVPDLLFAMPIKGFGGLWIEVKTPQGVVSPHQKEAIKRLRESGYMVEVVRSIDDGVNAINNYMKK